MPSYVSTNGSSSSTSGWPPWRRDVDVVVPPKTARPLRRSSAPASRRIRWTCTCRSRTSRTPRADRRAIGRIGSIRRVEEHAKPFAVDVRVLVLGKPLRSRTLITAWRLPALLGEPPGQDIGWGWCPSSPGSVICGTPRHGCGGTASAPPADVPGAARNASRIVSTPRGDDRDGARLLLRTCARVLHRYSLPIRCGALVRAAELPGLEGERGRSGRRGAGEKCEAKRRGLEPERRLARHGRNPARPAELGERVPMRVA